MDCCCRDVFGSPLPGFFEARTDEALALLFSRICGLVRSVLALFERYFYDAENANEKPFWLTVCHLNESHAGIELPIPLSSDVIRRSVVMSC
jgi:hypothetical protein